jgi:hypothetical protein
MRLRQWQKLEYYNPRGVLVALREFALAHPLNELPYALSALRTNQLKPYREGRQCALFCYAIGQVLGLDVRFAFNEQSDTDFVGRYELPGEVHFVPIQVKELVPNNVLSEVSLQGEIDKLSKYADSQDLVVAFHLNRDVRVELSKIDFSAVPVKELWFFGASAPDQENWVLIGNLLSTTAQYFEFKYPEV